jgi:hypothetical protein
MSEQQKEPARAWPARNRVVISHKFPVGAAVAQSTDGRVEKSSFRVTRHLPDSGAGLQYRIKDESDGRERVVTEAALSALRP